MYFFKDIKKNENNNLLLEHTVPYYKSIEGTGPAGRFAEPRKKVTSEALKYLQKDIFFIEKSYIFRFQQWLKIKIFPISILLWNIKQQKF